MSVQLNVPRSGFCTGLKPLQSSSPLGAALTLVLADTLAVVAAWAGMPLVQAMPNSSAIALIMPRSTLDLDLCTCDRSPHRLLLPDTCRYWDKNFIVLCDCDRYRLDQVVP